MAGTGGSSSSTSNPAIESPDLDVQLNPFHLHHSITSTATLVTQQLVGASNYISWSKAMHMALSGKNKLGFINGVIEKPTEGNRLVSWQCNNDIIASWIVNSVSKEIAASLVYTGSVKDIWDELKDRYRQVSGPHIYQLRKELANTLQGTLSVETY